MQYKKLGSADVKVSTVCLGTMTWGKQNSQQDANEQIDYAIERGVNCMDTAEMYAVPPSKETQGKTEEIIGNYFAANPGKRKELSVWSKIAGKGVPYMREGGNMTGAAVVEAVDNSLRRLQTDYIDLYQLHWPNRPSPHFNKHWINKIDFAEINTDEENAGMLDVLEGLQKCVKAGKIRYCGLSNESPWGIERYLHLSKENDLPRIVSLQNEFSLIHMKDWPYVVESCAVNDIAYLPWSPIGGGVLSGKYLNGALPKGSRWTFSQRNGVFRDQQGVHEAVAEYQAVAKKHNITTAQLALIWCHQFNWVTSSIIGATSMAQLKENIDAFEMTASEELMKDIDLVLRKFPIPYA